MDIFSLPAGQAFPTALPPDIPTMLNRTTTALLEDLGDPTNQAVWEAFDGRYRPIIIGVARKLGLQDEDAADAAQETLAQFVRSYRAGKYDPTRGRLSSWIIGIARHCIIDLQHKKFARREQRGVSAIGDIPEHNDLEQLFNAERDREILRIAIQSLHEESEFDPRTIKAFEMLSFHQLAAAQVAEELSMTANDVYLAKHRCLKKIRSKITQLSIVYEVE